MNKIFASLLLLITLLASGCRDKEPIDDRPGFVRFVVKPEAFDGTPIPAEGATNLVFSIVNDEGEAVVSGQRSPLNFVNSTQLSSPDITLPPGRYHLCLFIATDNDSKAIYAAPIQGSPLGGFPVERPLPVTFSILPNTLTTQDVEVMKIHFGSPKEFGYQTFDAGFVHLKLVRINVQLANIQPTSVWTWIRNLDTQERRWVQLAPRSGGRYGIEAVFNPGTYELETFANWSENGLQLTKSQRISASIDSNTQFEFNDIEGGEQKRRIVFNHATITVPTDFCQPVYTIYLSQSVCKTIFSHDKLINDISVGVDRGKAGTESCPAGSDQVDNTGKLVRAIPYASPACVEQFPQMTSASLFGLMSVFFADGTFEAYEYQNTYKPSNTMSQRTF